MSLGERLRILLEEKGITQKQLANSLNVGVSTLGNYIQDIREPDYDMLKCFASYFEVSTDYLLEHKTSQSESDHEVELLRIFRSLSPDQQEFFIEQGKLFIAQNNKKTKSSSSRTSAKRSG